MPAIAHMCPRKVHLTFAEWLHTQPPFRIAKHIFSVTFIGSEAKVEIVE
jgi:hypothetical protein